MSKKPRETAIIFDMGKPVVVREAIIGPDGGITLHGEDSVVVAPVQSHLRTSYERPKGPKIVHQVPYGRGQPSGKPNLALLGFGRVLACDTNTIVCDVGQISVGSVFELERRYEGQEVVVKLRPRFALEFRGVTTDQEKLSWVYVLIELQKKPSSGSVALVVDSYLDELDDINARRKPLLDEYKLPDWATLIYASADTGKEYLANKLLAECDEQASHILAGIADGRVGSEGLRAVQNPRYTHVRVWLADPGDKKGVYWVKRTP